MGETKLISHWRNELAYAAEGPQPHILLEDENVRVLIAGLEAGQKIPPHPEATAMYHFLEGCGWMITDGERLPVGPGATVVMPAGTVRGIEAETRLAFLATRITN
ncbi:MAG: hypothetical protein KDE09_01420 [Anaerolineales bacterium]|nr:hypothetical protein [Anaerolineales bacterium]MCB0016414.1 hypothetical protein [Anaerolineales bacterium]